MRIGSANTRKGAPHARGRPTPVRQQRRADHRAQGLRVAKPDEQHADRRGQARGRQVSRLDRLRAEIGDGAEHDTARGRVVSADEDGRRRHAIGARGSTMPGGLAPSQRRDPAGVLALLLAREGAKTPGTIRPGRPQPLAGTPSARFSAR